VKRVVEGHEVQGSGVGFQAPFPPAMGSGERCKLPQRPPSGFTTSEELRKASPDTSVVLLLWSHRNAIWLLPKIAYLSTHCHI